MLLSDLRACASRWEGTWEAEGAPDGEGCLRGTSWLPLSPGSLDGGRDGGRSDVPGVGVSNSWCCSATTAWLKPLGWEKQVHFCFAQG